MGRCQDSRLGNDWSPANHIASSNSQSNLENEFIQQYKQFVNRRSVVIRSIIWQTYDKRPSIWCGIRSTDYANRWRFTLREWRRTDTTGNSLLPNRISGSCCSIFDVIWDAAGRLVERVRPERKVWLLMVIQTSVRINCIRHRDQCWRISRISIRQGAGSHIVNCMELVDGQKML